MSHNPHRRGGSHRPGNPATFASRRFNSILMNHGDLGPLGGAQSCIGCGRGTDTAIAFKGEADWLAAGLVQLGVPTEHAIATIEHAPFLAFETWDDGDLVGRFRVCAECVSASTANFPAPVLTVVGAEIPLIEQKVRR